MCVTQTLPSGRAPIYRLMAKGGERRRRGGGDVEGGREGGTPVVCETCCVYVRETEKRESPVMCMRPVVCICEREREKEKYILCVCVRKMELSTMF